MPFPGNVPFLMSPSSLPFPGTLHKSHQRERETHMVQISLLPLMPHAHACPGPVRRPRRSTRPRSASACWMTLAWATSTTRTRPQSSCARWRRTSCTPAQGLLPSRRPSCLTSRCERQSNLCFLPARSHERARVNQTHHAPHAFAGDDSSRH